MRWYRLAAKAFLARNALAATSAASGGCAGGAVFVQYQPYYFTCSGGFSTSTETLTSTSCPPDGSATTNVLASSPSSVSPTVVSLSSIGIPAVSSPSTVIPMVSSPSIAVPVVSSPTINVPVVSSTSIAIPALSSTSINVPVVSSTSIAIPALSSTSINVPVVSSTSINIPLVSSTSINIPLVSSTSIALPSVSSPSINIPLPSSTNPIVILPASSSTLTSSAVVSSTSSASSSISCIKSASAIANLNIAVSTDLVVPPCATSLAFTVDGGSGGLADNLNFGGFGARLTGVLAVTPGTVLRLSAAGQGLDDGTPGFSFFGSGGRGYSGGAGGGGASALYVGGRLIAVGGGGGGGSRENQTPPNAPIRVTNDAHNGNASAIGLTREIQSQDGSIRYSNAGGGFPGTDTVPGTGGQWVGPGDENANGNSGNLTMGGDGVPSFAAAPNSNTTGGSGGGGGGFYGGGGGAAGYYIVMGVTAVASAGGGGGSSFMDSTVTEPVIDIIGISQPGRVFITFS